MRGSSSGPALALRGGAGFLPACGLESEELMQSAGELVQSHADLDLPGGKPVLIAASSLMREIETLARKAAVGEAKVLVTGESGVGKDLIARLVHVHSRRAAGPVRRRQLRGPHRNPPRVRAVRPRERQLHGRLPRQAWQAAARAPRHALPRRSRRDEPADAGAAPPLPRDRRNPERRRARRVEPT